jgi:hypothetical protein
MNYQKPVVRAYGPIHSVTGIFGSPTEEDQSFDPDGNEIDQGLGTVDQCASDDLVNCL